MLGEDKKGEMKESLLSQGNDPVSPGNGQEEAKATDLEALPENVHLEFEEDAENSAEFMANNGYNWDMVIVFPYPEKEKKRKVADEARAKIVEKLHSGGIETYMYFSVQKDEIICMLRLPLDSMKKFAHAIGYKLPLDKEELKRFCNEGGYDPKIAGFDITHNPKISKIEPFDHCYAKFFEEGDGTTIPLKLYELNCKGGKTPHPFSQVHRIKLIIALIEQKDSLNGCGIKWEDELAEKTMLAFYPLHNKEERDELKEKWIPGPCKRLFKFQPVDEIKEYFGERVALYFAFLGHYTTWLFVLSFVGIFLVVWDIIQLTLSSSFSPYFCLFVAFWSTFMLEYWKRHEATLAMEWGMAGFQEEELIRPDFYGEKIKSHIDGKHILYFDPRKKARYLALSQTIIFTFIGIVIAAVAGIFVFKNIMEVSSNYFLSTYYTYIAAGINAVQIQVFNVIYSKVAVWMNNFENHRTNTEYENNLIAKTFMFQFVNSYATFFYTAFIKKYFEGCDYGYLDVYDSCMYDLAISLGVIFGVRVASAHIIGVTIPRILAKYRKKQETKGVEEGKEFSEAEEQYILNPHDKLMDTLNDYSELSIQFGYATLFATAFPAAPLLAWIANIISTGVGAQKLTMEYRRAQPSGVEDIGTWQSIFELLAKAAVITNAGLVAYSSGILSYEGYSSTVQAWVFICAQYLVFSVMAFFDHVIDDVPFEVGIQNQRTKFITSKIIDRVPDEREDPDLDKKTASKGLGLGNIMGKMEVLNPFGHQTPKEEV